MKITKFRKCAEEELKIDNDGNNTLPRRCTEEEAKQNKCRVYINEEWKYVIGREIVDFVFLSVKSSLVYGEKEQVVDVLYLVELWTNGVLFTIELLQNEFYGEKWLREIRTGTLLLISKNNYQKLLKGIKPKAEEIFCFDRIGLHRVGGKYYYATSNCLVTAKGIDKSAKALIEGFDLECGEVIGDEKEDEKKSIGTFMKYSKWNYEVFYSIHCISIIAILRYFLKESGISAGAVLWIDGKVASGKTQLATTMGDFFNRGSEWGNYTKHLHTTKARVKVIAEELAKYKNAVFILDDIKKEETVRNRENAKNITDLLIRSIYTGKIGEAGIEEEEIDSTAIITGEFFKEKESTVSRVLYLNIDNFLQEEENSLQFREIQENKYYLAKFMSYFLQWLLAKAESGEYSLEEILKNLRLQAADCFRGELSTRMIETVANFQLVSEILNRYFQERNVNEKEREEFYENSKRALMELGKATLNRCLDYYPLMEQCFIEILPELLIKDCRYGEGYLNAVSKGVEYFEMNGLGSQYDDESGISDNGEIRGYEKLWLLGLEERYAGIMFNIKGHEVLLVGTEIICNLIREKIKENMQRWHVKLYNSELTDERILTGLLERQCLYGYRRKEGSFNKIIRFSEFTVMGEENGKFLEETERSMVKVNIDSKIKCKGLTRMGKISIKTLGNLFSDFKKFYRTHGRSDISIYEKKMKETFTEINRFLDLK